jgi:ABC-2 type transport system ATP-binding protein
LLSLRGLGKDYGARTAVAELDLDVPAGTIFGLLGPNGAGKTTAISMIAGVVTPSRGAATVGGHPVARGRAGFAARRAVGLVPQDLALYEELSADQNLAFFGSLYGLDRGTLAARAEWALGVVGLRERRGDVVSTFSGGMKRRLNLAAGLLHRPRLLILDEPTVGVDPQSRRHIFDTIRALRDDGLTVLYTSHYMEEVAELCDRIAILDGGELVAHGTLPELVARHGAPPELELELSGGEPALLAARAMAARHGAVSGSGALLRLPRPPRLGPLLTDIETAGATVAHLTTTPANLESVFLALTGHPLRDSPCAPPPPQSISRCWCAIGAR